MRLYTKQGDGGDTGFIGGHRVSKNHPRVTAYGEVDELNAMLGWIVAACDDEAWRERLHTIQDQLFHLGAHLANPEATTEVPTERDAEIESLEGWIDSATEEVAPLRHFILPGGNELASRFHLARAVCRRSERATVHLARVDRVAGRAITYLNRLSDLLFAWARLANARSRVPETIWRATDG